jgi:cytochrome oxidase assembly protein ShyY1
MSERRRTGGITDADPDDDIIPRVDIEEIADRLAGDPVPMFLELTASEPAQAGAYPQPLTEPELGEGPHLGYAVQWFIFSMCAAVGWVLAVRHSVRTRRRQAAANVSLAAAEDVPEPANAHHAEH